MTKILVTGGAGYIGSHACKMLRRAGFTPVTFDNLATGWQEAVKFGPFEQGDLLDRARVDAVFAAHQPAAVMHFAALSQVGESIQNPGRYWENNVAGDPQKLAGSRCRRRLVCRSCFPPPVPLMAIRIMLCWTEDSPQLPINAYGASKLAIEHMLRDFEMAHGLRHVIFRYFNVAGADPEGEVGEFHQPETHLIPLMLDAIAGKRGCADHFRDGLRHARRDLYS